MKTTVVLKDMKNHPAGYVRKTEQGVACRAKIGHPAQLALVFDDGSRAVHPLGCIDAEQQFCCDGNALSGCYAFLEEELLLVSDESMHHAFERDLRASRKTAVQQLPDKQIEDKAPRCKEETAKTDRQIEFPQRRWPPPPCLERAQYRGGCWRDE